MLYCVEVLQERVYREEMAKVRERVERGLTEKVKPLEGSRDYGLSHIVAAKGPQIVKCIAAVKYNAASSFSHV